MKKKKLNLEELKLDSFVTSFENYDKQTVKGGFLSLFNCHNDCPTDDCSNVSSCDPNIICGVGSEFPCQMKDPNDDNQQ